MSDLPNQSDSDPALFTIVQIVHLDETGDSAYRMKWPAEALPLKDPRLQVINIHSQAKERYEYAQSADLLVLFNNGDPDFLTVIKKRKEKGLKTICEFNDNFYAPQLWSPIAKEWSSAQLQSLYAKFLEVTDAVMVTGEGLHRLFTDKTNAPIEIIRNHLPFQPMMIAELISQKIPRSFGWAGSLGHIADILSVAPIIREVLHANPRGSFRIMGNESLSSSLHLTERFFYQPWGSIEDYYQFWQPVAVGLIPLLDTPYNDCRSDIKLIEMVAKGVYPIAPAAEPYQSLLKQFDIEGYTNLSEFRELTEQALAMTPAQRQQKLEPLFEWIKSNRIEATSTERLDMFRRYLPAKPQSTGIKAQPGYSFFIGSENSETPSTIELKHIQSLLASKNIDEAFHTLRSLTVDSPHHPEYAAAFAQLLSRVNPQLADVFVSDCLQAFPNDIRFYCQSIVLADSTPLRIERLRRLLGWLAALSKTTLRSVYEPIKKVLSLLIARDEQVIDTVEEFLLLFPFAYELRLQLAQHEARGSIREAKAHFSALKKASDNYHDGLKELADIDAGFIAAWDAAVSHRQSGRR